MIQIRQRRSIFLLLLLIFGCATILLSLADAQSSTSTSVKTDRSSIVCDTDAQCQNGGVCADPNEIHRHKYCHCAVGFVGARCNSFCPLDCLNGGYCRYQETTEPTRNDRNPDDYTCQCFGLFEGETCEIAYTNCGDGTKCYNGGVCKVESKINGNTGETNTMGRCDCPRGFSGPACEMTADDNITPSYSIPKEIQRNKTAVAFGIVFVVLFLAFCSWYSINFCWVDPLHYDSVATQGAPVSPCETNSPRWRNIV